MDFLVNQYMVIRFVHSTWNGKVFILSKYIVIPKATIKKNNYTKRYIQQQ